MKIPVKHPDYSEYIKLKAFVSNGPSIAAVQIIKELASPFVVEVLTEEFPHTFEYPEEFEFPSTTKSIGSCLELLQIYPEWDLGLFRLASSWPAWRYLMQNWKKVVQAYQTDDFETFQQLVTKIENKVIVNQIYEQFSQQSANAGI